MVCHGPDPPEDSEYEITARPRHDIELNGHEDSDEEMDHFGYEPLPQGPEAVHSDHENSDMEEDCNAPASQPASDVPPIEPVDIMITRQVWSAPRPEDPIQMDNERAQQVMSAMANFALPQTSIPEWAQSITEEQWKKTLSDKIEKLKSNR